MIYLYILLTIATLSLVGIVLMLLIIWRAILGKSSVELKLNTSVLMNSKKLENVRKSLSDNTVASGNLLTEIKDLKRVIKEDK